MVFAFERAISLRRGRRHSATVRQTIPAPGGARASSIATGRIELCLENGSPVAMVFAADRAKWGRPSVELEQAIIDAGDRAARTVAPLHAAVQCRGNDSAR